MYIGQDRQWQDWALPYIARRGFGLFYFALNPDSDDTGGLVLKDWSVPPAGAPEALKLAALAQLPSTSVASICPQCLEAANRTDASGVLSARAACRGCSRCLGSNGC